MGACRLLLSVRGTPPGLGLRKPGGWGLGELPATLPLPPGARTPPLGCCLWGPHGPGGHLPSLLPTGCLQPG